MLNKEEIESVLRNPHLYSFNEDGDEKEAEKILFADIRLMSVDELLSFLDCIEIKAFPEVKMGEEIRKEETEETAEEIAKRLTIENLETEQIEHRHLENEFLEEFERDNSEKEGFLIAT